MDSQASYAVPRSDAEERLLARIAALEREVEQLRARQDAQRPYWQQLEAIVELAPNAIYLKDAEFKYLFVNREYERLSAVPRARILGRTDFDVLAQPVAQLFRDQDLEVIAHGAPRDFKETIPLPDGVHTFITSKFPLRSPPGEITGVAGLCTEITALEQVKQRLEQAQAEMLKRERLATVGELAAVLAHEVRNPVGVVFNALAALEHAVPPGHACRQMLAIIGEENERLDRMVGALLDLARPAAGGRRWLSLEAVVASAIEAARVLAESAEDVRLQVGEGLAPALVDEQMLFQALVNLVTNALRAPGRRSPVRVSLSAEGRDRETVRIEVADDGAGVPPHLVDRIFEPFFTTRAKGTGLGLAVVRRAAELHRGTIDVEQTPGGGATFVWRMPRQPDLGASVPAR